MHINDVIGSGVFSILRKGFITHLLYNYGQIFTYHKGTHFKKVRLIAEYENKKKVKTKQF